MSETIRNEPRLHGPNAGSYLLLSYAIAILAQLPLLAMYSMELWRRVHYQFFPIAVAFTIYLAWQRWPRESQQPFVASRLSSLCMLVGLLVGVAGAAFVYPWFAAVSVTLLAISLLARTIDRETGRSLVACALPLIPCVYLPMGLDGRLINWLQRLSAEFTSRLLDMVGFVHQMNGTVIGTATGREFGVAEACSGVTSFFMLVFCAIALCVWNRHGIVRTLILIALAAYWSIIMNTIRIMAIPLADSILSIDLTEGPMHDALGYGTMGIGFALLVSSDCMISAIVAKYFPQWARRDAEMIAKTERIPIRSPAIGLTWVSSLILLVGGLFSASDVYRNYVEMDRYKVRFFDADEQVSMKEGDLPARLRDWNLTAYQSEDRGRGSELGQHSDIWIYQSPRCNATVSLDQPFPGWHELTTCYLGTGWKMTSRTIENPIDDDFQIDGKPWPYVVAEFQRGETERGYLLFSFFDGNGQPYEPPADWGAVKAFMTRAKNRLSNRIRAGLFQGSAYQTQAFLTGSGDISPEVKQDALRSYLLLREEMRQSFLVRRKAGSNDST